MNLLRRSREEPEINLTSLIDVVLLLLVFFMVSTSFVREAEINIRLPAASAEPVQQAVTEQLEISITESGSYLVNGRLLATSDGRNLRRAIEQVVGERRDLPVSIRPDAAADVQSLTTVMSVVGELGFVDLSFATVNDAETR